MRKLIVAVTAGAAVLAAGSLANRAEAMPAGAGLRHAIEDSDLTDKVHCRWGYGCYGGYYRYSYYPPYPYYYPRYRYYPRYAVAPFVIHVGPRYHRWRYRY
jgi:hypothetical protein